jgi:hypothetical protein
LNSALSKERSRDGRNCWEERCASVDGIEVMKAEWKKNEEK